MCCLSTSVHVVHHLEAHICPKKVSQPRPPKVCLPVLFMSSFCLFACFYEVIMTSVLHWGGETTAQHYPLVLRPNKYSFSLQAAETSVSFIGNSNLI